MKEEMKEDRCRCKNQPEGTALIEDFENNVLRCSVCGKIYSTMRGRPEIKKRDDWKEELKEALKKDFENLYVKEYTASWKEDRFVRNVEINTMSLKNVEKLINKLLFKLNNKQK